MKQLWISLSIYDRQGQTSGKDAALACVNATTSLPYIDTCTLMLEPLRFGTGSQCLLIHLSRHWVQAIDQPYAGGVCTLKLNNTHGVIAGKIR